MWSDCWTFLCVVTGLSSVAEGSSVVSSLLSSLFNNKGNELNKENRSTEISRKSESGNNNNSNNNNIGKKFNSKSKSLLEKEQNKKVLVTKDSINSSKSKKIKNANLSKNTNLKN